MGWEKQDHDSCFAARQGSKVVEKSIPFVAESKRNDIQGLSVERYLWS
jgi:hypothetical protein